MVYVGIGVGIAAGSTAQKTPNAIYLPGGTRAVVGWYTTLSGFGGAITTDGASVPATIPTWTNNYLDVSAGVSDPYGGTSAYSALEQSGAGTQYHRNRGTVSAGIAAYQDFDVWLQANGANETWIDKSGVVNSQAVVNNTSGAVSSTGAAVDSCSLVESSGTWRHWHIEWRDGTAGTIQLIVVELGGSSVNYDAGSGGRGHNVYLPSYTQIRAAEIPDRSLLANGLPRLANLSMATDANQLLYWNETLAEVVLHREVGRVAYASATHADVIGAAAGDDPAKGVCGIAALNGNGARVCRWWYDSSNYDIPLVVVAGELRSQRCVGGSLSDKQIGSGLGTLLATPQTFALVGNADRTVDVFVAGALRATITHDDLGSMPTPTAFTLGSDDATTTYEEKHVDLAVWSGALGGSAPVDRYNAHIRPWLQRLGAACGGLQA